MSHSSGIPVAQALTDTYGDALTSNTTRAVKVQIVNDELVPTGSLPLGSDYEEDLDKVPTLLDATQPCYVLFRLDEKNPASAGFLWVLMCYVPDKAKVREKMTYASTRSNLRKQLGSSNFSTEIFGTVANDFNKQGYKSHVAMQKSENPLTWGERQSMQEKEQSVAYVGGGTSTAYVHGVAFPVTSDATQALQGLLSGAHNYVQIAIDVEKETIILDHTGNVSIDTLGDEVPVNEQPRFHFFRYEHTHEDQSLSPIVMVYSCPDGSNNTKSAPVKLRMLYSSSKANIENILSNLGGKVDVKLEVNQGTEVTPAVVNNLLHPQKEEEKKTFAKPKGPAKAGKRLIRDNK